MLKKSWKKVSKSHKRKSWNFIFEILNPEETGSSFIRLVARWFPPGTPVSFTSETDISSSSFHLFDIKVAVAEALSPNKPNLDMTLAVAEALSPNKPNLDMTMAVAEALSPNTPNMMH